MEVYKQYRLALAFSWSTLWGAINFAYLTLPTRRKKLFCILSLRPITGKSNDTCSLFCHALHTVISTTVSWYPSVIPSMCLWNYTLKTKHYSVCYVPYGFSRKREQLEKIVDFSHATPKHIRSAERLLFLLPPSLRLSGNFVIGESSMGSLAVLSPSCTPFYGGEASVGDAATSARFIRV